MAEVAFSPLDENCQFEVEYRYVSGFLAYLSETRSFRQRYVFSEQATGVVAISGYNDAEAESIVEALRMPFRDDAPKGQGYLKPKQSRAIDLTNAASEGRALKLRTRMSREGLAVSNRKGNPLGEIVINKPTFVGIQNNLHEVARNEWLVGAPEASVTSDLERQIREAAEEGLTGIFGVTEDLLRDSAFPRAYESNRVPVAWLPRDI